MFPFENTWLARLRLAPAVEFAAGVGVRDGRVISRDVGYTSCCSPEAWAWFGATEHLARPGVPSFKVHISRDKEGRLAKVFVDMTTEATAEQREGVYSIDFGCFGKIGGCKHGVGIFPAFFQAQEPGSSSGGWRSLCASERLGMHGLCGYPTL